MLHLTPEFMRHAAGPFTQRAAGNDSGSEADAGGVLTLEMRDNPAASFMRKFERLIDLAPKEAFRMAHVALIDKIFDSRIEGKIRLRMNDLIDSIHQNEHKPGISGPFLKIVLDISPQRQPESLWTSSPTPAFTR